MMIILLTCKSLPALVIMWLEIGQVRSDNNRRHHHLLLPSSLADSLDWQNKQVYYCYELFITQASMQKLAWTSKGQITALKFP